MNHIYIIGHKSPDLDSVAAAVSYANLKNIISQKCQDKKRTYTAKVSQNLKNTKSIKNQDIKTVYHPAIAGEINEETKHSLKKFSFNKPKLLKNAANKNIILVDHNEFTQAVNGIEKANIIEVLDHHRVNFQHSEPIIFKSLPWGATCSIIAQEYIDKNISLNKNLASLMLAAILIDTVITKSPTCAEKDKEIINKLSAIAKIKNWQEFGMELFKIRSNVANLSAKNMIKSDFKDFQFNAGKFGVGQVETVDFNEFKSRYNELLTELDKIRQSQNYHSVILMITDIIKEGSTFLVSTSDEKAINKVLNAKLKNNQFYLDKIISRKKQVVPMLNVL